MFDDVGGKNVLDKGNRRRAPLDVEEEVFVVPRQEGGRVCPQVGFVVNVAGGVPAGSSNTAAAAVEGSADLLRFEGGSSSGTSAAPRLFVAEGLDSSSRKAPLAG